MNFVKLQATGNDFVLIDARGLERDWAALARDMCHRHFGVGADGLLLVLGSAAAPLRLRMFNPDGSEAEACGNGLRCFARYAIEGGLADGPEFGVETISGTRIVRAEAGQSVQVGMGAPIFTAVEIPVSVAGRDPRDRSPVIDYPISVGSRDLIVSCLSMGNPHAVCFLAEPVDAFPLHEVGPQVEHHPMFPNRVNFGVVNVVSRKELSARVWERGVGETLSCGTGACAVAVVSRLKGLSEDTVDIKLPGGILTVTWDGAGEVLLSGPAQIVFGGEWVDQEVVRNQGMVSKEH